MDSGTGVDSDWIIGFRIDIAHTGISLPPVERQVDHIHAVVDRDRGVILESRQLEVDVAKVTIRAGIAAAEMIKVLADGYVIGVGAGVSLL